MTTPGRIVLPNRRNSQVFDFEYSGVRYRALFSRDSSGRIAEMFLNAGKEGSAAAIIAKECAVILSIALQFRTPIETISAALPLLPDGSPAWPVGMALAQIQSSPPQEGR